MCCSSVSVSSCGNSQQPRDVSHDQNPTPLDCVIPRPAGSVVGDIDTFSIHNAHCHIAAGISFINKVYWNLRFRHMVGLIKILILILIMIGSAIATTKYAHRNYGVKMLHNLGLHGTNHSNKSWPSHAYRSCLVGNHVLWQFLWSLCEQPRSCANTSHSTKTSTFSILDQNHKHCAPHIRQAFNSSLAADGTVMLSNCYPVAATWSTNLRVAIVNVLAFVISTVLLHSTQRELVTSFLILSTTFQVLVLCISIGCDLEFALLAILPWCIVAPVLLNTIVQFRHVILSGRRMGFKDWSESQHSLDCDTKVQGCAKV
jgi:hypothetical protein